MTDGNLLEQCDDTINNYEEDIDHLYNVKPGNIYKLGNHRLMCGQYDYCKYCNKNNSYPCAKSFNKFKRKN